MRRGPLAGDVLSENRSLCPVEITMRSALSISFVVFFTSTFANFESWVRTTFGMSCIRGCLSKTEDLGWRLATD